MISLAGRLDGRRHLLDLRVYYEDTDALGMVYHASYLRFMERGRTDMLRLCGYDQQTLFATRELGFVVRRMALEFLAPARLDDVLTVTSETTDVRGATLLIDQAVMKGETPLVTAKVTVACLEKGRPRRIPDDLRAAFTG